MQLCGIHFALSLLVLGLNFPCTAMAQSSAEPISPIPDRPELDKKKVELGRELFFDPMLSHDNTVSCASCHDLSKNGSNDQQFATGIGGKLSSRNTPTVFNSALNFRQFWDGRAVTLEEQVSGPLENPNEMGSSWPEVLAKLKSRSDYERKFRGAYGSQLTKENVANAISHFERTLVTPNSRFDSFLKGNPSAISRAEKLGYEKFKNYGCVACHQGVNVGGNMFQAMGVMADYFQDRKKPDGDMGRFELTRRERDRHVFRVPSLRNVARTAPYFHDGSEPTLSGAVRIMGKYQLGRDLPEQDVELIVKFLRTLDGELPKIGPAASGNNP
jgi:cytochrome c peroxidase